MHFLNRPQKFIKCKIKESDVMMIKNLNKNKEINNDNIQQPVRVIMNNFTLSIFENEDYFSNFFTFDLEFTSFKISQSKNWCFVLEQNSNKVELCPFSMKKDYKFNQEWKNDFEMFKYKCRTQKHTSELENLMKNKLQNKIDEALKKTNQEKIFLIDKNLKKINDEKLYNNMINVAKLSAEALEKENLIEEMITREEEDRENYKIKSLEKIVEMEQEKQNNFQRTIQRKELESDQKIIEQENLEKIIEIMKGQEDGTVIQRFCIAILQKMSVKEDTIQYYMKHGLIDWIIKLLQRSRISEVHIFCLDFASALLANILHSNVTLDYLEKNLPICKNVNLF